MGNAAEEINLDELMDLGGEIGSGLDADEQSLEALKKELEEPAEERFGSVDDLLETEKIEHDGQWEECPFVDGLFFLLAHTSASAEKYRQLESAWKLKHRKPVDFDMNLMPTVQYRLFLAALFGPAIKSWESRGGKPAPPVTLDGYKRLMKSRRLSSWLIEQCGNLQRFRDKREEAVGEI